MTKKKLTPEQIQKRKRRNKLRRERRRKRKLTGLLNGKKSKQGLAPGGNTRVRTARIRQSGKSGDYILSGTDYVARISLPTMVTSDNAMRHMSYLQPAALPETRLSQLARNWEKYKFTKFRIVYKPSVPYTIGGQIILWYDPNPSNPVNHGTDVELLTREVIAKRSNKITAINTAATLECAVHEANSGIKDGWFVDETVKEDIKWYAQGIFGVLADISPSAAAQLTSTINVGVVMVEWECKLITPQLPKEIVPGTDDQQVDDWEHWGYWAQLKVLDTTDWKISYKSTGAVGTAAMPYWNNAGYWIVTPLKYDATKNGVTNNDTINKLIMDGVVFTNKEGGTALMGDVSDDLKDIPLNGPPDNDLIGKQFLFLDGNAYGFRNDGVIPPARDFQGQGIQFTFTTNGIRIGRPTISASTTSALISQAGGPMEYVGLTRLIHRAKTLKVSAPSSYRIKRSVEIKDLWKPESIITNSAKIAQLEQDLSELRHHLRRQRLDDYVFE